MKIKIALLGFGKTGRVVAQNLCHSERFDLVFVAKNKVIKPDEFDFVVESKELIGELVSQFKPDVVVDLTTPDAVMLNINKLPKKTAYIIATTGFTSVQLNQIKEYEHLKVLYAPNISDGINVVIKACELFNKIWNGADVEIVEQHFNDKKDSPSGTANKIAKAFNREVPIHSIRAGGIIGVHEIILATDNQKITLKHESFNKDVFAEGVKRAAIWLMDKECGFYEIDEVYQ
jgi:4-hydroxy-tetrahydrodipicolinate reductase